MPYDFQVHEAYVVDAGWLYCMAAGIGQFDEVQYEAAITGLNNPLREDAIAALVTPQLAAMGFVNGEWSILHLSDEYVDYQGFPLPFGEEYVAFTLASIETEAHGNMPVSKTINYSAAAQQLVNTLGIPMGDFEPITLIEVLRLDREEEDLDEQP